MLRKCTKKYYTFDMLNLNQSNMKKATIKVVKPGTGGGTIPTTKK